MLQNPFQVIKDDSIPNLRDEENIFQEIKKKREKKKMISTSEAPSLIALEIVFNQSKPFSKNKKQPDSQPKRSRKPISRNEGKKREEEDETKLPNAISHGIGYLQSMQNHFKKIKDNPIPIPSNQRSPFQEVRK